MKRRSGARGQPPRPHKAASPKHRNTKNETRKRGASIAVRETVVGRLTRERDEALEQLSAASEVLRMISSSPELEPVFETILQSATRICEAKFGELDLFDGTGFRWAAQIGTPPQLMEFQKKRESFQPLPGGQMDLVMRTKQVIHTVPPSLLAIADEVIE